ncbi:hypothetical protein KSF_063950 [Reticulibacter mediterranei]|uniref:Glycoside hydrolase n=2 Tax=Reticulibacter mediterranei TaxID=2778369 RepID=A0A8J3N6Q2_9CHLR|nr:hypothetical protein KSF_063950 [Reticulibacter mediterranei]
MQKVSWKGRLRQKRVILFILAVVGVSCLVNLALLPRLIYASTLQDDSQPISRNRPAIASSTLSVTRSPQAAVDGNSKTRWTSATGAVQWLAVDFDTSATFQRVVLQWDTSYARAYTLQVSDDGSRWTVIYTQNNGQGNTETMDVVGKGRYIRLVATNGVTKNGYSLWELQVYGQAGTATPTPTVEATPTVEPTPTVETTSTPDVEPTATSGTELTPTPTIPADSNASPSGEAMPKGDLPGWHQVFTEDFSTDVAIGGFLNAYGKKFTVYDDGWPDTAGSYHGAPSRYYPSKVLSAKGGLLDLYLHTEKGTPMAAAILPILKDHMYGKYTIRFKSDSLKGFKTAWLLWPDSQNGGEGAADGEIDFPEGPLDGNINAFMHPKGGGQQDAFDSGVAYTSWHTASLEWSPGKVKFILDGKSIGTSTKGVPNTPMQWVIQTESCLDGCPSPSTAGHLQIDWAVAYTPAS